MRNYSFIDKYSTLLSPDIVSLLSQIHEFKGKQAKLMVTGRDTLTKLVEIAKIQSTEASNKIEGIYTSDERLKKIVQEKTMPRTRGEKEIAGYRDVLAAIHESHDYIPLRPSVILQLHRDLYKYSGLAIGGQYKNSDNIIEEIDAAGNKTVRFQPVSAWETPESMDRLCAAYDEALREPTVDPLLLLPMFILDFLCIHPFNDGNGRMSRLLTLLLLYRAGYDVGKYISIERLIETSKETYYEVLLESSDGWHEENNDYAPFARYMLGVVVAAYREFDQRAQMLTDPNLSKPDRVRELIKDTLGTVTKAQIMEKCPDVAQITVQRALNELVKSGQVIKLGGGRYTAYTWNREKD